MQYTVVLTDAEEGGYTAHCLELPAAISEGDTRKAALENIKEAIQLVLEVTEEQARVLGEITKVDVASV
ncbi:type II toxin-antitoxin system HicB family antitoxin [Methanohalophilus profundi]|uniref:type II toxin-antitoxin system HicB family antitoxin n=1 Tax=Methanohalophilus profundi TaxID=2138083 RepID=UPI00101BBFF7|nr:type II toxin-antitoxin system HicB family antitoxin [Methanohalophilus profundi]